MGSRIAAYRFATVLQGGVVQALPAAPPGQRQQGGGGGGRAVQVPGAAVRLPEQAERPLQAAHGEPSNLNVIRS